MDIIERMTAVAKAGDWRIVLPEGEDGRIVRAARRLLDDGIANPVLLGRRAKIAAMARAVETALNGITVIDPDASERLDAYAHAYATGRRRLDHKLAIRLARKPLYFAAMMVTMGDADAMVAGSANPTRRVIEAGLLGIGLAEGIHTPSSYFLMRVPRFMGGMDKVFIYADCAINADPSAEELADIALASAATGKLLLSETPRVAMLSFSTLGSARHERVNKVTRALALAQERAPDLAIDGEFQVDSALISEIAARKVKRPSPVAGRANILIFPDLDSGNVAYKLTQYMAGAQAVGPILQGFSKPLSDLSRGASVDDVVTTASVLLAQASYASAAAHHLD